MFEVDLNVHDLGHVTDAQLAVLLRQAQWALDEAAHDLPAGRCTPQAREDLAAALESLAAVVRGGTPPLVIPGEDM